MRPHRTESGVFNTGRRKCRGLLLVEPEQIGLRCGPHACDLLPPGRRPGRGDLAPKVRSQTRGTRDNVPVASFIAVFL